MPDDETPATGQATTARPWPSPGRWRGEGTPSALDHRASSRGIPPRSIQAAGSVPAIDADWLYLPGTPWSMRRARASADRPVLEVYAAGVAHRRDGGFFTSQPAAARSVQDSHREASPRHRLGCLPAAQGEAPSVEFISGHIRRRGQLQEAESVAGWFWFADACGRFRKVAISGQAQRASCPTRTVGAC